MLEMIFAPLYALIGGFLNRWRGTGVLELGLGQFYKRLIVSFWLTLPILLLWSVNYVDWYVIPAWLGLTYFVGLVPGWGSYFDLGRNLRGWSDDPEVLWIDAVLMGLFGPKIITLYETETTEKYTAKVNEYQRWDVWSYTRLLFAKRIPFWWKWKFVVNADYAHRNYAWRRARDFVGLSLRGLHFTLPTGLLLHFTGSLIDSWAVWTYTFSGFAMGLIYLISYQLPTVPLTKYFLERGTGWAEFLFGMYLSVLTYSLFLWRF